MIRETRRRVKAAEEKAGLTIRFPVIVCTRHDGSAEATQNWGAIMQDFMDGKFSSVDMDDENLAGLFDALKPDGTTVTAHTDPAWRDHAKKNLK